MTRHFRYGRRDRNPPSAPVGAEDVFDQLIDRVLQNGDVNGGLDQLAREGFDLERAGQQIRGLNSMLDEIRRKKEERLQERSIESAAQDLRSRLEQVVRWETAAVDRRLGRKPAPAGKEAPEEGEEGSASSAAAREAAERRRTLENLPRRVSDAVEALQSYPFLDAQAAEEYRSLARALEEIRRFEEFRRRYGPRFRGKTPMSFEEAQELMKEFHRMEQIEESLQRGDPGGVEPGALEPILGTEARQSLDVLQEMSAVLEAAGYVVATGERLSLTPEGIRRIGFKALQDIYGVIRKTLSGDHRANRRGTGHLLLDHAKPYQFGDPFHLDVSGTLRNSILRHAGRKSAADRSFEPPLALAVEDLDVFEEETTSRAATALLLDMSWSMSLGNKFLAAKRVALALQELIRSRFPRDRLHLVGFFTVAIELAAKNLATLELNLGDPFTNIQDALKLAEQLLQRDRIPNAQIIVVTDGQPTAYYMERRLHVEWPVFGISPTAFRETLRQVDHCTRRGIRINTFMLDEDPSLVHFVEEMTRINRGRAFYTTPEDLGRYLLVDYLEHRRKRVA